MSQKSKDLICTMVETWNHKLKKNYNLWFLVTNSGLDHQIYIPSKDSNVSVYLYVQASFRVDPALYSVVIRTVFLWVK